MHLPSTCPDATRIDDTEKPNSLFLFSSANAIQTSKLSNHRNIRTPSNNGLVIRSLLKLRRICLLLLMVYRLGLLRLLLRSIHHLRDRLRLVGHGCWAAFSIVDLLGLLHQRAAHAAVGDEAIAAAVRFDAVFVPQAPARDALQTTLEPEAGQHAPAHTTTIATAWIFLRRVLPPSLRFPV